MQDIETVLSQEFYMNHGELLDRTYKSITGNHLLNYESSSDSKIVDLYNAPFAVVSHGLEADPIFNFGNRLALKLFALSWSDFIALPSRQSAEQVEREERIKLLNEVTEKGYIDDYSGIRIASTGRRFVIHQALVWNLINDQGRYCGQAAMFKKWKYL